MQKIHKLKNQNSLLIMKERFDTTDSQEMMQNKSLCNMPISSDEWISWFLWNARMEIGTFERFEIHDTPLDYVRWTTDDTKTSLQIIKQTESCRWSIAFRNGNKERLTIDRTESSKERIRGAKTMWKNVLVLRNNDAYACKNSSNNKDSFQ